MSIGLILVASSVIYIASNQAQPAGVLIDADPISDVYIDGQKMGATPYEATLDAGEVLLKIVPQAGKDVFDDYKTKINLVPGVRTIIKRSFRETERMSSGVVVSFEKARPQDSLVTVVSVPEGGEVRVNDKLYGQAPIKISLEPGDHQLTVYANGYLEKSLPIKVYRGYKLTAFVKLSEDGEEVSNSQKEEEDVSEQGLNEIKFKVKIDQNDVGFLRVRSGANTGFPEIAQVKPDEIYSVIDEGEGGSWYKIVLGDGQIGWISAEFATKLNP